MVKMKIALIRPNSIIVASPAPIGLGYLAGYLLKNRSDQIEIINARRLGLSAEAAADSQLSGYSSLTVNLSAVPDQRLKRFKKRACREFYFSPFRIWSNLLLAPKDFRTVRSIWDVAMLSSKDSVNY